MIKTCDIEIMPGVGGTVTVTWIPTAKATPKMQENISLHFGKFTVVSRFYHKVLLRFGNISIILTRYPLVSILFVGTLGNMAKM